MVITYSSKIIHDTYHNEKLIFQLWFIVSQNIYHFIFFLVELGDHQYCRVDRKTDIARHEGVRGQLRGQNFRRYPAVGLSNRR